MSVGHQSVNKTNQLTVVFGYLRDFDDRALSHAMSVHLILRLRFNYVAHPTLRHLPTHIYPPKTKLVSPPAGPVKPLPPAMTTSCLFEPSRAPEFGSPLPDIPLDDSLSITQFVFANVHSYDDTKAFVDASGRSVSFKAVADLSNRVGIFAFRRLLGLTTLTGCQGIPKHWSETQRCCLHL